MAISKEKLREMRENSRRGAAKQRAKEQAALDRYMKRRNTEVAKMMSAKERNEAIKKAYTEEGKSIEQIMEAFELTSKRVCKILGISEKPSGVIDAAELTTEEREVLTAQAEADAGIVPERTENAQERTENAACVDVGEIAGRIKYMMQIAMKSLDLPENLDVDFCLRNGLCELDIADNDESAMLTWRL